MLRSRLMSGTAPLYSPDGVGGGGAAPGGAATEPPPAAAEAAPAAAAAAAAAPAAEALSPDAGAAGAKEIPAGAKEAPAADGKPGDAAAAADVKPAKDFAPSLLDEAAKPTADAKPGDAAPAKDAAKPADAKPSDKKEPAPAEAKPGDKPADAKPEEATAPIEYAFVYPDGIKPEDLNAERLGAFTGILNDVRAAPEAGQKLLNLHLEEMTRVTQEVEQRSSERQWDVFANQQKDWRDRVMADPELGGARHGTAIKTVMGLIDAFSLRPQEDNKVRSAEAIAAERKELLDVARMTGVANNPTFLRLLHWAGDKLTREGSPRPAPPPRQAAPNAGNKGLNRYKGTTPAT